MHSISHIPPSRRNRQITPNRPISNLTPSTPFAPKPPDEFNPLTRKLCRSHKSNVDCPSASAAVRRIPARIPRLTWTAGAALELVLVVRLAKVGSKRLMLCAEVSWRGGGDQSETLTVTAFALTKVWMRRWRVCNHATRLKGLERGNNGDSNLLNPSFSSLVGRCL